MTAKELRRILKQVADDTEILIGKAAIARIERGFNDKKMHLVIIPK